MAAFAQVEKISVKLVPEPNQTVRMRMVQDVEMDLSFEGEIPAAGALPGPMKMMARTVFALTQKVGAPDREGNFISELTYDEVSSEMTMNGQPMQIGNPSGKFTGQKIMTTFNRQGEMIDLKMPPSLELSEESFKKMMKSFYGDLPQTPIGVGEIVTTPLDFTFPLPVPGGAPMKIEGQIKYALASIEKGETGRIAKFNQKVEGNMVSDMEMPRPKGHRKMSLDFKLNGGGDMVMDVDRGVLKSSDSKTTFAGKLKMIDESNAAKSTVVNMQGAFKTTIMGGY